MLQNIYKTPEKNEKKKQHKVTSENNPGLAPQILILSQIITWLVCLNGSYSLSGEVYVLS